MPVMSKLAEHLGLSHFVLDWRELCGMNRRSMRLRKEEEFKRIIKIVLILRYDRKAKNCINVRSIFEVM